MAAAGLALTPALYKDFLGNPTPFWTVLSGPCSADGQEAMRDRADAMEVQLETFLEALEREKQEVKEQWALLISYSGICGIF
jgi:hypothetical protein